MKVEDHPIEYGDFEGVIPEGYGAGIVMLWDRGTWSPQTDDVDAALKKGDLKFTLDGFKLKGSWVLVRTSGKFAGARSGSDGRSWLLIKHRDEWSGDLDITEFAPKSVKSEGDFEDILAGDTPAVWISNRPARPAAGGEAGAMLETIIQRAAALKAGRTSAPPRKREQTGQVTATAAAKPRKTAAAKKSAPNAKRKSTKTGSR